VAHAAVERGGTRTAIWWVRRDLRLGDNQALAAAADQADQVLPVFVLDPTLLGSSWVGEKRLAFLYDGLRALDEDLRRRGSYLIVRGGDPVHVLAGLRQETAAEVILAEADYSPYARRRDDRAARELPIEFMLGLTVHAPEDVLKADGTPYTVFTPFSRAWKARPWPGDPLPAPRRIATPPGIKSQGVPAAPRLSETVPFRSGEAEAKRRLATFARKALASYEDGRNRMALAGTSGLSPYLRFGMLSARQAVKAARRAQKTATDARARRSAEAWLNELIWREFYITVLYHFPHARRAAFRPGLRNIPWINNRRDFAVWSEGRTGYPIVDAAMRQLLQIGWMHNRARMISASFLTKDLLIDWRWGERHFMQHLVDGDPASNNGGWQWAAGTGTDAAPYFRVLNPVLQGARFDPDGAYVRRFVPELASVPSKYIHNPWTMPVDVQKRARCFIGKDYPAPLVDHKLARERALQAYRTPSSSLNRRPVRRQPERRRSR
jgi:deoxyribodipyrimidine photo-lyase